MSPTPPYDVALRWIGYMHHGRANAEDQTYKLLPSTLTKRNGGPITDQETWTDEAWGR
jgi:hypothetical protein